MKWFNVRQGYLIIILILSVFVIAGCGSKGGGSGSGHWDEGDTDRPFVVLVAPVDGAADVALDANVTATFNEPMDGSTITGTTFTVKHGITSVSGNVTYSGVTATFNPTGSLIANTIYTATITTGAKDPSANALASNYVWHFSTPPADTTPPIVVLSVPICNATDVPLNTLISATFSEAMDNSTIDTTTFTLFNGTQDTGAVDTSGLTSIFTPDSPLIANTVYTATVTTGVQDLAGNAMVSDYICTFTTGFTNDITAPTVISTIPADLATGVGLTSNVSALFSEAMNPLMINTTTFTLFHGITQVTGTVSYVGLTGTFHPSSPLIANTLYDAEITTGVQDLAGNPMALNYDWSFTTLLPSAIGLGPLPVDLGTAADFAAIGKSGISCAACTVVGDLGVSPIDHTAFTGFAGFVEDGSNEFWTSTDVTGRLYAADNVPPTPAKMTTAVSDMETAFTDAAGQVSGRYRRTGRRKHQRYEPRPRTLQVEHRVVDYKCRRYPHGWPE